MYDPLVLFVNLEFILAWTPKSSKRVGFRDMTNFSFTMYLKQKKASALGGFNFANLALELINRNYLQEHLICSKLGALSLLNWNRSRIKKTSIWNLLICIFAYQERACSYTYLIADAYNTAGSTLDSIQYLNFSWDIQTCHS